MRKLYAGLSAIFIIMMATGAIGQTFTFFMQETIEVNGQMVLKVDNEFVENTQLSSNITIGAGETVILNHTVEYVGMNDQFNITVYNSNGFEGMEHNLYLDGVPLDHNYVILDQGVIYNLGIEFVADYNLSGTGSDNYVLEISPSPEQP